MLIGLISELPDQALILFSKNFYFQIKCQATHDYKDSLPNITEITLGAVPISFPTIKACLRIIGWYAMIGTNPMINLNTCDMYLITGLFTLIQYKPI